MRDEQTLKIELLSQWKLEAEFRNNKLLLIISKCGKEQQTWKVKVEV